MYEKLKHLTKKTSEVKCIRLIEPNVDENAVLQSLLDSPRREDLTMFHFDITSSVIMTLKSLFNFEKYSFLMRLVSKAD